MPLNLDDLDGLPPRPHQAAQASAEKVRVIRRYLDAVHQLDLESLNLYRPLPFQEAFHRCTAKEAILVKANQAGGSLAAFVEVARAVTNQDPYKKYPQSGVAVCVGYGEGHIGRVIHKYLFRFGAFQIIQDAVTGRWRTFRPWESTKEINGEFGDRGRESEARPSPPLIPKRFIDGKLSWKDRANNVFGMAMLTTGWEIHAFNSQGDAEMAQGFQADLYLIDEDVATEGWYTEALGRTAARRGKIRWNALPHNKTDDLVQMAERAELQAKDPDPMTVCFRATMYDNPYYPEESKRHNETAWRSQGEEIYRARALGEFTIDSTRMYPMFSKDIHNVTARLSPREEQLEQQGKQLRTAVQRLLINTNGEPPLDWCRYLVFDPGYTVGAVLFFAVPPPQIFGNFKIAYDELYIMNCTGGVWIDRVEEKLRDRHFQDFIIDSHGSHLREQTTGVLPRRQYELELERRQLECEARGSRFLNGSDDIEGREMALRRWLEIRRGATGPEYGYPTFMINVERCPNTCRELINFRKLTTRQGGRDITTDKGNRRSGTHTVECCEYAAAHGMPYIAPPRKVHASLSYADQIRAGRQRRAAKRRANRSGTGDGHINLGPLGSGS